MFLISARPEPYLLDTVMLKEEKSFLLFHYSNGGFQEKQCMTLLSCNLDDALRVVQKGYKIEKIQILEPPVVCDEGWRLHDVIRIERITAMTEEEDGESYRPEPREHYLTSLGRCFTFSRLDDDDPVRDTPGELIYSAASGCETCD